MKILRAQVHGADDDLYVVDTKQQVGDACLDVVRRRLRAGYYWDLEDSDSEFFNNLTAERAEQFLIDRVEVDGEDEGWWVVETRCTQPS